MTADSRKAIFLDIDGTLVADGGKPSRYDADRLMEAKSLGHMVFLNTGRSYAFIPDLLRDAPFVDGIVAGGGAHVLLGGRTLYHRTIAEDLLCEISALYLRIGKWCQFEGETDNYRVVDNGTMKVVTSADDFRTRYRGALISKITMEGCVSPGEREVLGPWFDLYRMPGYSEGIIRGESKTRGIRRILEAVGIPIENTVGIGDSANDVEMIRSVAFGIAMGNGVAELKQAAKAVTDDCRNNGVGKAIRKYVLKQG